MRVAVRRLQHEALAVAGFGREAEGAARPQYPRHLREHLGQIAEVDEHVGRHHQVEGRAFLRQEGHDVGAGQAVVQAGRARLVQHPLREVDAGQRARARLQVRRAQAGAAAQFEHVAAARRLRPLPQLRPAQGGIDGGRRAVVQHFGQVLVEVPGILVEQRLDVVLRRPLRRAADAERGQREVDLADVATLRRHDPARGAVGRDGFALAPQRQQGRRAVLVRGGVIGPQRQRPVVAAQRLVEAAQLVQRHAAAGVGLGHLRIDGQRAVVGIDRVAQAAQQVQRVGAHAQCLRIARLAGQGALGAVERGLRLAQVEQGRRAVAGRLRVGRPERQRALVAVHRLLRPPELAQRIAAVRERHGIAGMQAQGLVVGGQCIGAAAQILQGSAQVAVGRRLGRVDGDGLADQRHRPRGVALLAMDHAEQVQGVELVRRGGQHRAVQVLGLRQPACLVVGDGLLQQRGDVMLSCLFHYRLSNRDRRKDTASACHAARQSAIIPSSQQ